MLLLVEQEINTNKVQGEVLVVDFSRFFSWV